MNGRPATLTPRVYLSFCHSPKGNRRRRPTIEFAKELAYGYCHFYLFIYIYFCLTFRTEYQTNYHYVTDVAPSLSLTLILNVHNL